MNSEEAIQYFNDEIRLCRAAPSINGCQMTEDWQRTIDACEIAVAAIRKVQELVQAEQDGRLVVLPCALEADIFRVSKKTILGDWQVAYAEVYPDAIIMIDDSDNHFEADDIGKTVFLTREEAEAALAGKGGEG